MTLDRIYRDVISALNAPKEHIKQRDVTNLINEVITQIRVEHILNTGGYEFAVTEMIWALIEDFEYPRFYKAKLKRPLLRSLPISQTVKQSLVVDACDEITRKPASFRKGDRAVYKGKTYVATRDIEDEVTNRLTFSTDRRRTWRINNKTRYRKGDIIEYEGSFYRVVDDFYNERTYENFQDTPVEEVVWRLEQDSFYQMSYMEFSRLHEGGLTKVIDDHYPFSIKDNHIYTTFDKTPVTVTYIPEWIFIDDLDQKLDIPDSFYLTIRNRTIDLLVSKLGLNENRTTELE